MCGRYTLATPDWVEADFSTSFPTLADELRRPRYNVAPGQMVLALTRAGEGRTATEAMLWGVEANWKDGPPQVINARGEKLAGSRFWKQMLESGRCAIPADGFYEWRAAATRNGRKQPYWYTRSGNERFAFAGLYTPGSDDVNQCVIVTVEPNELVEDVHDRMPAMLRPEDIGSWLDGDADEALAALRPFPSTEMSARPVSSAVGNVANESPELIEPVDIEPPPQQEPTLF